MALVSYSDSESESESPPSTRPPAPNPPSKKPFQKVVDRSNGKIIVTLAQPSTSSASPSDDQPPTKRARTADTSAGGGGGGGLFKGFNSFLPPPKNNLRSAPIKPSSASAQAPRPGVHLKTSAEVGFSRGDHDFPQPAGGDGPGIRAQPSVSEDLKPAAEVKLVGKPLLFKPLSVARGGTKKKPKPSPATNTTTTTTTTTNTNTPAAQTTSTSPAAAPAAPRKSLFGLHVQEPSPDPAPGMDFPEIPYPSDPWTAQAQFPTQSLSTAQPHLPTPATASVSSAAPSSLATAADDLGLSAAARRELFGRAGRDSSILTLDMDTEYRHNEQLRAAGDTQLHNPVRAIQGGGKHSLRQLVHNVVNQREALEDSFAKGKSNRKEASNKYGW